MKFCYPAIFKKTENGAYEVTFPDLAGCTARGKNYEEALSEAKEAETDWLTIELIEDLGQPPFVSDAGDIAVSEDETVQLVAVNLRFMEGWDE